MKYSLVPVFFAQKIMALQVNSGPLPQTIEHLPKTVGLKSRGFRLQSADDCNRRASNCLTMSAGELLIRPDRHTLSSSCKKWPLRCPSSDRPRRSVCPFLPGARHRRLLIGKLRFFHGKRLLGPSVCQLSLVIVQPIFREEVTIFANCVVFVTVSSSNIAVSSIDYIITKLLIKQFIVANPIHILL